MHAMSFGGHIFPVWMF